MPQTAGTASASDYRTLKTWRNTFKSHPEQRKRYRQQNAKCKYTLTRIDSVPLDETVGLRDAGLARCNTNTKFELTSLLDAFCVQRKKELQTVEDKDSTSNDNCPHTNIQCIDHLQAAVLPFSLNPEE